MLLIETVPAPLGDKTIPLSVAVLVMVISAAAMLAMVLVLLVKVRLVTPKLVKPVGAATKETVGVVVPLTPILVPAITLVTGAVPLTAAVTRPLASVVMLLTKV